MIVRNAPSNWSKSSINRLGRREEWGLGCQWSIIWLHVICCLFWYVRNWLEHVVQLTVIFTFFGRCGRCFRLPYCFIKSGRVWVNWTSDPLRRSLSNCSLIDSGWAYLRYVAINVECGGLRRRTEVIVDFKLLFAVENVGLGTSIFLLFFDQRQIVPSLVSGDCANIVRLSSQYIIIRWLEHGIELVASNSMVLDEGPFWAWYSWQEATSTLLLLRGAVHDHGCLQILLRRPMTS